MQSTDRAGPASWAGRGRDSTDSRFAVHWDPQHASADPEMLRSSDAQQRHDSSQRQNSQQELRRRRSSIAERLRTAGGLNSLDNFARSWQRAQGFHEVMPTRPSFRFTDGAESEDPSMYSRTGEIDTSPATQRSLLREQLEREQQGIAPHQITEAIAEDGEEPQHLSRTSSGPRRTQDGSEQSPLLGHRLSRQQSPNILSIEPHLASPFATSYGSAWGSYSSRVNESSMRHAGRLFRQQQAPDSSEPDKEREPLLVKQIQDDEGNIVNVVVGQSTVPQTIFNSINTLVGVGILALPLAIRYAGWLCGSIFMIFAALATSYTAKLLAKCADTDPTILTFLDIAEAAFGTTVQTGTAVLFCLELVGASVALVVLFADSLDALIPGYGLILWKIACGLILLPLAFAPLRYLGYTSLIGIACTFGITILILVAGVIKPESPGSILDPATTYLFPANWMTLPISFGLLMSPWGGHSVFPNIYRDMRHPQRYNTAVNTTYVFTFLLDVLMAVVGYLMFGDGVLDEVTRNIVTMVPGYPKWISFLIVVAIAIIPLTKVPLNAVPIIETLEKLFGLHPRSIGPEESLTGFTPLTRGLFKYTIRIFTTALFVVLAIAIPEFDRIMSLIGAVACFTICIILPCAFHLKLFSKELSGVQKAVDWALIVVSSILALVSTGFNFVPKESLGIAPASVGLSSYASTGTMGV